MRSRLVLPAELAGRVFTVAEAAAAGASEWLLRSPAVRAVWPRVYADARLPDGPLLRFDAIRLLAPDTWATCHTAAAAHQLPVPADVGLHVGYPPGRTRPRFDGLIPHRSAVPLTSPDLTQVLGRPVETPLATVDRMRQHLGLFDLVVLADASVRRGGVSLHDLRARADRAVGRGSRLLVAAAGLSREGVDAPTETRLRLLVRFSGLPEPVVGHELRSDDGTPLARFDLCWPAAKVALDYDGASHLTPRGKDRDVRRRELLDGIGWRLVVVTARDLFVLPGPTVDRIWHVLRARDPAVPRPTDGWRRYLGAGPSTASRVRGSSPRRR